MSFIIIRKVKNIIIKNDFGSFITAKIYLIINRYFLKKKIFEIFKFKKYWLHKTKFGYLAYSHPLFDPDQYINTNYDIFFEKYKPKKNDCVVELGAGVGSETLIISKLIGDTGKILSVEPFKQVFELLNQTIKFNNLKNVILINKALYKSNTSIGFASDTQNWLGGKIDNLSENKVYTLTLDDLVFEYKLKEINFCKINIEGSEKYILNSSSNFLDICQNLAIECHDFLPGDEYKTYDKIKSFLIKKKFRVTNSQRKKYPWDKFFIFAEK